MALVLHGEGPAGDPLPEEVPYRLSPGEEVPYAETHRLFMTLDVDGGMVDIAVTLVVPRFGPPAGDPPRFEDPEVTWDVQDGDGAHIRTLVWDEAARSCIWSSKSFRNGKRSFPIW